MTARFGTHGSGWAAAGGLLALVAAALLPFHAGGGLGGWIAAGFGLAGLALAGASMALGARFPRGRQGGGMRSWAVLGAAGFAVSGAGLVMDVLEAPIVTSEIGAVAALAAWWAAVGWRLRSRARAFAGFSLLCAAAGAAAIVLQIAWSAAPAGAVPARFAYALWGPWGLWLTPVLARLERGA